MAEPLDSYAAAVAAVTAAEAAIDDAIAAEETPGPATAILAAAKQAASRGHAALTEEAGRHTARLAAIE